MALRYPNGKLFKNDKNEGSSTQKRKISYANRGMTLEEDLNVTNEYYLSNGIAVVHKKPTPVQIVNVDYKSRSTAVIKEAYFKQPSTTDYNGIYKGKYIDFEAKETNNTTSFPLQNFHDHQIKHMKQVHEHGGIVFVILRFNKTEEHFILLLPQLLEYWDRMENGGRKSIKKEEIESHGHKVSVGYHPRIDYISVIHTIYI